MIQQLSAFWSVRVEWAKQPFCLILANTAESSGWVTARATCVAGMLEDILIRTQRATRHLVDIEPARKIKGAGIADFISLELEDSPRELSN